MSPSKPRPVTDLYEENASWWATQRGRGSFPEESYLARILEALPPTGEVLDLGCGSGSPIGRYFLARGRRLTGVDASASMLRIAEETLPEGEWIRADMRGLALGRSFDALVAWDSFFHLGQEEQERMFPVFRSHLRPGGLLLFTSGPERGEAIGDLNGHPLFHSSLAPAEYRALLAASGFEVLSFDPENPGCGGHTVRLCRRRAEG